MMRRRSQYPAWPLLPMPHWNGSGFHYTASEEEQVKVLTAEYHKRIEEYFWSKVVKTDGCWIWTGARNNAYSGFGSSTAYRFLWERILRQPLPRGMHLHHACENKMCVRPDHLEALTPKQHSQAHAILRRLRQAAIVRGATRAFATWTMDLPMPMRRIEVEPWYEVVHFLS